MNNIKNYTNFLNEKKETENNNERKNELLLYLKNRNFTDYVGVLNDMMKDPKTKALIEDGFGGELGDVKLKFSEQVISVKKLMPTQNEIDIDKSINRTFKNPIAVNDCYKPKVELGFPLVTFNNTWIIDGHHRWSQVLCTNPDAKMVCVNYNGDISPIQMLKATQGAIAAAEGKVPSNKVEGKNIYDCEEDDLRKYIDEKINDETVDNIKKYNKDLKDKDDVVNFMVDNGMELINDHPIMLFAPKRDVMPQTDLSGGGDPNKEGSALNKLRNGKVTAIPGKK